MPDNGSGTFTRTNGTASGSNVWEQDDLAARKITSDLHDEHDQDIANALNARLCRNGENSMSGDLDMSGNDIVAVDDITVNGTGRFNSNILVFANSTVDAKLNVNGGIEVYGGIDILTGTLDVDGNITTGGSFIGNLTGNVAGNVTGNLTGNVTGDLTGDVTADLITATTKVTTPEIALTGSRVITGQAVLNDGFVSDDDGTINGNLDVTGGFTAGNDSEIDGNITVTGDIVHKSYTKQAISGTAGQPFDLDSGWHVDSTISGDQELEFSNGVLGANGVIKLINTNGNTLRLSGAGLTFKKCTNGLLSAYGDITLESGASTEQIVTYHFQSATEVIYTV